MAFPTAVNGQITDLAAPTATGQVTDGVTQTNVKILGEDPATGQASAAATAVNGQITDALDTAVNSQITDAVTQANVKVLANAPAIALGSLYQNLAHASSLAMHNAVTAQQNTQVTAQAATTQGVALLLSLFR